MTEELTPAQKRAEAAAEFNRKYGEHWLVYLALIFTASLSFVSGLILPFQPDAAGLITFSVGGVLTALYYAVGFLSNGEGATSYWFGKLTDHDKDNTAQKIIAGVMLAVSVIVSLVTALAAAAQIAYLLGVLAEFQAMPTWAQEWVVWSIPVMWTLNAVAGMAFKTFSDEAAADRDAAAVIRAAKLRMHTRRVQAKADYIDANADLLAARLGEMEAQKELTEYAIQLNAGTSKKPAEPSQPPRQHNASVDIAPSIVDEGNPTPANTPRPRS